MKTYNGWSNYETWCVNLWLDNDQGTQEMWAESTARIWEESEPSRNWTRKEEAVSALAEMLKEELAVVPDEVTGMMADLLGAALGEVDWHEIAEHMVENHIQEEGVSDE